MGSRRRGRRRGQPGRPGAEVRTPRRLGRLGAVLEACEGLTGRSQPRESGAVVPLPLGAASVTAPRRPRCARVRLRRGMPRSACGERFLLTVRGQVPCVRAWGAGARHWFTEYFIKMALKRNAVVRRRLCLWHATLSLLRFLSEMRSPCLKRRGRDPWGGKKQTKKVYLGVWGTPDVVFVQPCGRGEKGEGVGVVLHQPYRTVCADGVEYREAGKFCAEISKTSTAELFCSPGSTRQFR